MEKISKRKRKDSQKNKNKKKKSKMSILQDENEENVEKNKNIKVVKLSEKKEEEREDEEVKKAGEKKSKTKRRPKSVNNELKSNSKSNSKSKSKNSSKRKSSKQKRVVKIKKGYDYIKGKYNLLIHPMKKSKYLKDPSKNIFNECCINCSNRNCYRAVITKNYELMENCIKSKDNISGIFSPIYKNGPNPIEKAIENNDEKMIEIMLNYLTQNKKEIRCIPEQSQIKHIETGETNVYMFGVKTRKLNATRGNKMGNDALINDDPNYLNDENNKSNIEKSITKSLLTKNHNEKLIEFIKAIIINPVSLTETLYFDFSEYIHLSLLSGNKEISSYLLNQVQGNYNYGFNSLHSDVLNLKNPNDIKIKVKTSLTKKPQTNLGVTPMHVACINPDTRFIQKLVELGGDWNCLDLENKKPFHYAACCEGEGPLNYLISLGALIDETDKMKNTALILAAMNGRLENVKILLNKKANYLLKDKINKNTAFHYACINGHLDIVEYFLDYTDIKIDLPGNEKMTGLMFAAMNGHKKLVKFLIDRGAKLTKKDKFKRNCIINCIRTGKIEIINFLLSNGAEFDLPDSSNNYPIHYACAYGWIEIVEMLIEAGADANVQNDWKLTPMEVAFLKNHFFIVKYLLDSNLCDINTKFNMDMRLIHYSFKNLTLKSFNEIKYFIKEKKADVNAVNYYGLSCLHMIADYDYHNFINNNDIYFNDINVNKNLTREEKENIKYNKYKKLIHDIFTLLNENKNLDIDLITKEGKTALQIALENRNIPVLEELIKMKPKLYFQDSHGKTIFHVIIKFVFGDEKERNILKMIIESIKNSMKNEDLENIINAYDDNGFTPFLALFYEYSKQIKNKYDKYLSNHIFQMKKEIYYQSEKIEENKEDEDVNNPFSNNNYNSNIENLINNIQLTQLQINNCIKKAKDDFYKFLECFHEIVKIFISLKMNPLKKVCKLSAYRVRPTNSNERKSLNDKTNIPINLRIEQQYFEKNGKNTAFIYLMSFPYFPLVEFFTNNIKDSINQINLYKKNAIFFLFDNLSQIYQIEKNDNLAIKVLKYLIDQKINLNQIDYQGNTLFMYLIKIWNIELLKILYKSGIDINKCNKLDENPLIYEVRKKNLSKVKILIEEFKVDINYQNNLKRTCMHYLYNDEIENTDTDESLNDYLLSLKPKLDIKDILGRTPLFYLFVKINNEFNATIIDPISSLTKLLEYENVNPDICDIYGNSPLHYASQRGSIISILSLLTKNVQIDKKNNEKNTPLTYSLLFKHINIAINFISQNANLENNAYPLKGRNEKEILKEILKKENELNSKNQLSQKNTNFLSTLSQALNSSFELDTQIPNISKDDNKNDNNLENIIEENIDKKDKKKEKKQKNDQNNDDEESDEDIENEIENSDINDNNNNIVFNEDEDSDYDSQNESEESNDSGNNNQNNNNFKINQNHKYRISNFNNKQAAGGFGNNIIQSNYNNNNPFLNRNNNGLFNNNNNPFLNRNIHNYNNNNYFNNPQDKEEEKINCQYFHNENERKEGIKLFRICIRNNLQGITYLFLSKNYPLMQSVEDSFYEKKFNLSMKLLNQSPNNSIYNHKNIYGQNLFHILGKISGSSDKKTLNNFFDKLYSKDISLDLKDMEGNTPLHYAASNHFIEFCQFILNKGKTFLLDESNNYNESPFICAIKNNINNISSQLVNLLFSKKTINNVYIEESFGKNYKVTSLLYIVRLLLKNPNQLKEKGNNKVFILNKLLDNNASIIEKDIFGRNSLIYCVIENNLDLLKLLISNVKKKDIPKDLQDNDGKTLVSLCVAVNDFGSYENTEMLKYLLDNNFNATIPDNNNNTPIDLSVKQSSKKNYSILKKYNITNNNENIDLYQNYEEEDNNFESPYNYEKDSNEYFELMQKLAPKEKRIKLPNLSDYQGELYELYQENDEYWEASLTKVNIQNGVYGEYMFYFIQLIHDKGKDMYIVTTQFGRIGDEGENQRSPFNSLDEAKNEFGKIFKSKTGNLWENRENFERVKGKYMLIKFNKVQLTARELLKPIDYNNCPSSTIKDKNVQELLKIFTDSSIYFKAIRDNGINTEFFNFSMLNKELLKKAKEYIIEIYNKLNELKELTNPMNRVNEDNKKREEKINNITKISNDIMILSSRYYELIPKEKYKNTFIQPFGTINEVQSEILMLDNLSYVERAVNILLGAQSQSKKINPIDYVYNSLQTKFNLIKNNTSEYETIEKYIHNSSPNTKVKNIFSVNRKGENENMKKWEKLDNHYLLFHGTKIFNYIGIFSNGLKIAPPEAPSTGYLYGKGIYLADEFNKSINYCDSFYNKNDKKNYSYILLCEAALGKIYECGANQFKDLSFLNEGYNSLKGLSNMGPDLSKSFICNNGIVIPLGEIIPYVDMKNIGFNRIQRTQMPEYIIYDTTQVKIKYIIQIENN